MTKYILGYANWQKEYLSSQENKRRIWTYIKLSNGVEIYLKEYKEWLTFGEYCKKHSANIIEIGLRYRSNLVSVDSSKADGVYLIRSVKGEFGGVTKQCYTIGLLNGSVMSKTMWLTPELIEESSYDDDLENCFEEALIYNDKEKT